MKRAKSYLEEYLEDNESGPNYPYKYLGKGIPPHLNHRSLRADRYAALTFYLVPAILIAVVLVIVGEDLYTKIFSALAAFVLAAIIYRSAKNAMKSK
jgi:hypothetical protein